MDIPLIRLFSGLKNMESKNPDLKTDFLSLEGSEFSKFV